MKKNFTKIMSLALALLIAGSCFPTLSFAEEAKEEKAPSIETKEEENKITKDETVYVNLNADGSLREAIITDKIHSDKADIVVEDKTDLKDVELIKGGSLKEEKDGKIYWQLEGKDLYYRGKSQKKLPFEISIKYFLDGKEMKPEKLAGKSGDLKITLDFKNNSVEKINYKGKTVSFQSPMAIAAILSLPTENFSNVEGENVAITTEGDNTMVAVASVPGLYKSLNLDENKLTEIEDLELPEHFEITCKVENFKMNNIAATATGGFPEEAEEFDLSFIDELDENLQKVKRIKDNFDNMDDDRTLRDMLLDDEKLSDLQELSKDIDELLNMNTSFANNLDKYFTDDAVKSLTDIIDNFQDFDLRYLKDFDYAENTNNKVTNPQLGKGVEKALELFDTINMQDLNAAYMGQKMLKTGSNEAMARMGCYKLLGLSMGIDDMAEMENMFGSLSVTEMFPLIANIDVNTLIQNKIATLTNVKKMQYTYEAMLNKAMNGASGVSLEDAPVMNSGAVPPTPARPSTALSKEEMQAIQMKAFNDAKTEVMTALGDPALMAQVKNLQKMAKTSVAVQHNLQPMMDATIAMGEFPRDAYLLTMIHSAYDIYQDFLKLYPTIALMQGDLKDPNVRDSFENSADMVKILVRLKKQLDENPELSDALRKLQDDDNIEIIKDIVNTLDEIDKDELVDIYTDKINKLQDMVERKDILKDMAERRTVYTDKADNMETSYKFVLKTDEIEIPKDDEKVAVKEEPTGLKKFFGNLFK